MNKERKHRVWSIIWKTVYVTATVLLCYHVGLILPTLLVPEDYL